jgi:hypothetical protein
VVRVNSWSEDKPKAGLRSDFHLRQDGLSRQCLLFVVGPAGRSGAGNEARGFMPLCVQRWLKDHARGRKEWSGETKCCGQPH